MTLGLGSNLGDSLRWLRLGVAGLPDVTKVSGVYRTAPIGGPEQPPYLNIVVELATELGPYEVLDRAARLERDAGRARIERWGPRTLDIDVLRYDDLRLDDPRLEIPHPRMLERRFVLAPLAEVAADLVSVAQLDVVVDQEIELLGDLGDLAEP